MKAPTYKIGIAIICAAIAATLAVRMWPEPSPLMAELICLEAANHAAPKNSAKRVTIRLRNLGSKPITFAQSKLQFCVNNVWHESPDLIDLDHLSPRAKGNEIEVIVPSKSAACRLSFKYRNGPSPYCAALGFVTKHDLDKRFPALSRWTLAKFPKKPMLRESAIELKLT
jgi:hypothetical protein